MPRFSPLFLVFWGGRGCDTGKDIPCEYVFYTLGCKVNLNETGALEQLFERNGFTVVPEGQPADVYIVNSCTVTNFGDQKSRKWLRQAKRNNPGAVTVLTGCYPQAFPEAAARLMEADLVCGNTDRRAILDNVQKLLAGHERIVAIQPHARGEAFEEMPVDRFESHTRAFIKVEDGCNRRCAYCIIPKARGPVRSRAEASVLDELRQLAAAGYQEVVLSAISLPSYGTDTGTSLYELIEHCAQVEGIQRIRLGSLDPDMLTEEGIQRLAAVNKLCPPVPPEPSERLRRHPAADAAALHRRPVPGHRQPNPGRLRGPAGQLHHRLHLRLPRGDRRGFRDQLRLPGTGGVFAGPCVPLLPPGGGRRPSASPTRSTSGKSSAAAGPCTCGPRRCGKRSWPGWKAPRTRCCWKPPCRPPSSPATPGCMCRCLFRRRAALRGKLSGCGWGNTTAPGSAPSSWGRCAEPGKILCYFFDAFLPSALFKPGKM